MSPSPSPRRAEPPTDDHRGLFGFADHSSGLTAANDAIPDSDVREVLERLLADGRLRMSDRNRRFLRFVVEQTLAGRAERIKSYAIAVDVFGRAPTFDSVTDPIVRIEATRLRAALAAYYEGPGAAEIIRIDLPKGAYLPAFYRVQEKLATGKPRTAPRRMRLWESASRRMLLFSIAGLPVAALAGVTLLGGLRAGLADPDAGTPVIAVTPVKSLTPGQGSEEIAQGLTQSLLSNLSRFPGLRLVHLRGSEASIADLKSPPRPTYLMESSLRVSDGALRFWWSVVDGRTQETLWSENIDQSRDDDVRQTIEDRIASRVAARVAEPYGIVGQEQQPGGDGPTAYGYTCVLRARAQHAFPLPERHDRIKACLEQTVAFAPQYSDAWAMLALTYLYEDRPLSRSQVPVAELTAMGLEAAERAVQLAPNSSLAYLAILTARFRMGNFAAAEAAGARALELNPNDPEILHAVGLRAYVREATAEALDQIRKSLQLSSRARPSAQFILALDAYRRGDYTDAMRQLKTAGGGGVPLSLLLCAATHAQLGQADEARRDIEVLLSRQPDYGRALRSDLAALHFNENLTELLVSGARLAGLAAE